MVGFYKMVCRTKLQNPSSSHVDEITASKSAVWSHIDDRRYMFVHLRNSHWVSVLFPSSIPFSA